CCAEAPSTRPTLREVSEKVKAIQETGQRNTGGGGEQHAAAAGLSSSDGMSRSLAMTATGATSQPSAAAAGAGATTQQGQGDDLLGLFDHVQSSSKPSVGDGGGSGATKSSQQQQRTPTRRPQPPPPPYDTAIQNSSPKRATTAPPPPAAKQPPPYREALAAQQGGPLLAIDGDDGVGEEKAAAGGGGELVDLGQDFSRQISASSGESGGGGAGNNPGAVGTTTTGREWWAASSSSAKPYSEAPAPAPAGRNPATTMGPSLGSIVGGAGGGRGGGGSTGSALSDLGRGGGVGSGGGGSSSKNDSSISCTLSTSLAEYAAGLPGVLRAAKSGGVLSSNPRLLCVCNNNSSSNNGIVSSPADAGGAEGGGPGAGQQDSAGHVSVLDLWHRGRTVRYPVAADRAAMSPNQSESVIAVLGGGSLHVFSIPRRCRLQEQAVATDLCMWRWLSPWSLALVTDGAVFYWSVLDSSMGGNSPERGSSTGGGGGGLDRDVSGAGDAATNERESTARSRRPRQAFARRRTLTRSDTLHRVYDYQASADGRWGLLLCAVVDNDWGGGGGGGSGALGNGYGSHSSGIEGGGGPVKVDLHSFERGTTFEFEVLGASLMTMPGSSPPLNLLGLVVRGEGGATELRVLDLDRSLAQAEGAEDLERLAELGEGWLIATTHVIADGDLRGSCSYRVVGVDGRERGGVGGEEATRGGGEAPPLVSPPVFLRQWTENTNVVFVVGCHGLLLVLDVVTGAELARAQACAAPLIEAEVDPDVGDLVVVSTADGGGVHRLGVRAAALRESVEYYHKDPEMATRVSALTGYAGVRPLPPPRRQA
ncbi:unnamed protein product, partial [Ectocarpus fasciculatus]